jgi:DNA-binding response OmpR family regulator
MRLDPEIHEVSRHDRAIRLTPIEFRIFHLLAINAGRVVTNDRLLSYVWGHEGGNPNALRCHICHIRTKLELGDPETGVIMGVPTVGYSFRLGRRPAAENESVIGVAGAARPSLARA